MKLAIDIDGCLACFNVPFHARLVERYGMRNQPHGYDPAHPSVWDWPQLLGYDHIQIDTVWKSCWEDPLFWQRLEELPYASETIHLLDKLSFAGHDVYYITNRKGIKCKQQTERWLEARGSYNPTVLICADKIPIYNALQIDALVDDRLTTINEACGRTECRVYARNTLHNLEGRHPRARAVNSVWDMVMQEMGINKVRLT